MHNWRKEAERFTPELKVLVLQGHDRQTYFDQIHDVDIILSTYPLLARDEDFFLAHQYHMLILDEAQNTTTEQMKMFLTRLGFGAKAVITGDLSQIDLPRHIKSGLLDAKEKLQDIEGIYFHTFTSEDVVRHPLVQKIVESGRHWHHEFPHHQILLFERVKRHPQIFE